MRAMTQARIKCKRTQEIMHVRIDGHTLTLFCFQAHSRMHAQKLPDLLVRGGGDAGVAVPPAHQPAAEGRGGGVVVRGRLPQVPTYR